MHFVLWLIFRQPHPDFISVRLKNLGTTDKKSSHKIKHKKIPRVYFCVMIEFSISKRKEAVKKL